MIPPECIECSCGCGNDQTNCKRSIVSEPPWHDCVIQFLVPEDVDNDVIWNNFDTSPGILPAGWEPIESGYGTFSFRVNTLPSVDDAKLVMEILKNFSR